MKNPDKTIPQIIVFIIFCIVMIIFPYHVGYDKGFDQAMDDCVNTDFYQVGFDYGQRELIDIIVNECQHAPTPLYYRDTNFILVRFYPLNLE